MYNLTKAVGNKFLCFKNEHCNTLKINSNSVNVREEEKHRLSF